MQRSSMCSLLKGALSTAARTIMITRMITATRTIITRMRRERSYIIMITATSIIMNIITSTLITIMERTRMTTDMEMRTMRTGTIIMIIVTIIITSIAATPISLG